MASQLTLRLRGMITPLATPLIDSDTLDQTAFGKLIEHVIGGGVNGIFLLGTTGEAQALSYRLRAEIIERACAQVRRRVVILAGISDTSYVESRRLADVAQQAGADALVAAPPYYQRHSQADLTCHIERMARELPLPLFLYNIPSLTKIAFEAETVARASEIPGVLGLKDSSFDMDYLRAVLDGVRHKPDFSVFLGPEQLLLEGLRHGIHGGVCGGSNLNPSLLVGLVRVFRGGNYGLAAELQRQVQATCDALYTTGDPETCYLRGIKFALGELGFGNGLCAVPTRPFSEAEQARIREGLHSLELARSAVTKVDVS